MTRLELPTFKTREEEAAFWDSTDLGPYMEDAEQITLEWTEREDRCERCAGGMDTRPIDLHLAGDRLVMHGVPLYVCRTPGCGNTQLPSAIRDLAERLEALVQEALSVQPAPSYEQLAPRPPAQIAWHPLAVQQTPAPAPALVREDRPPYGEEEDEED
jgi:hypothetical protein